MREKIYLQFARNGRLNFVFFLLCLTLVFSLDYPLSVFLFKNILPYDQQRLLELFLLIAVPVFLMMGRECRNLFWGVVSHIPRKQQVLLLSFFLLGFVSCCFAKMISMAFLEWSVYALLFLLGFCFSVLAILYREKCIYLMLTVLYVSIAAYVYPVFEATYHGLVSRTPIHFFPYFTNLRFFTQFAIFMMPLLPLADLYLVEKGRRDYWRVLFALLAIFWWALFIVNGSRGAIYAVVIAVFVLCCLFRKNLLPWLWRQACYIGIASIVTYLLDERSYHTAENQLVQQQLSHLHTFTDATLSPRLALYHYAFHLMREYPWLGVGPMHYAYGPPRYLILAGHLAAHPHNFMLLILSEWGIPAGIAMGIFLLMSIFQCGKWCLTVNASAMASYQKVVIASLAMSLLAGLLCACVSGVTVTPLSQIWLSLIAGLLLGMRGIDQSSRQIHWFWMMVVGVMMVWSIVTVCVVVIPSVGTLKQAEITWLIQHGLTAKVSPRFWMQGWIGS